MSETRRSILPISCASLPKLRSYNLNNFRDIPQVANLSTQQQFDIEVVGHVLPFKVNNYVIDQLIDWNKVPNDPIYALTFPQRDMLSAEHYDEIATLLKRGADKAEIKEAANRIRMQLNPHPTGQADHNVPEMDGERLHGMQHKTGRPSCSSPARARPATPTALSASAGRSLSA